MPKKKKKLRPMGEITSEMELLLEELTDPEGHDLQMQEIICQHVQWIQTHAPHAIPIYVGDGTHPVVYIGHYSGIK